MIKERKGEVTFKANPLTLVGNALKISDKAPDVQVVDSQLNQVSLVSSFKNKPVVILTVPSLDTEVCSLETKKFNQKFEQFKDKAILATVSMDLPFAQKRWCAAEHVANAKTFSDYKGALFGQAYGVLIKELHLLARAVFVIDKEGIVRYIELVKEMTSEPNYEKVLQELTKVL